jgi:serine/threonine-protein kinase
LTLRNRTAEPAGYEIGAVIGRGGMGEVALACDPEIGRDVAIKRMRAEKASPEATARFLREARLQARLEHPAIVPVHELGRDANDRPYFTMKRITGVTLADVLASSSPPPQNKLLRAFADVCRAVDFAHARSVVHRDLKPANIMLGDFGEVYVLDWGLARVIGDPETAPIGQGVASLDGMTQAGTLLGTPGYMAPEQVEDAHAIGPPADVYSLGSILFGILTGERLHHEGPGMLARTLEGVRQGPAARRPDRGVPPERDALCLAAVGIATARPTARELADRIEGYLDGDRDVQRRRELAAREVAAAREELASGDPARRASAMKAAGRALALDPESRDAADLISRLMLEPPRDPPPALRAELAASEIAVQRRQGRVATWSFAAVLAYLGAAAWNGLTDWVLIGAIAAFTLVLASAAYLVSRRAMPSYVMLLVSCGNALLVALMSRAFGPLLVVPAVTCVMALSLTSYPQNIDRARVVIALLAIGWLGPVALEWAGVLVPTWQVVEGAVISTSSMIEIGGAPTAALLVFANLAAIVVSGLFANALAVSRRDAQRQSEIREWHWKQLLPAR